MGIFDHAIKQGFLWRYIEINGEIKVGRGVVWSCKKADIMGVASCMEMETKAMQFEGKLKMKNETYGVSSREARKVFEKMPSFSHSFTPSSHCSFVWLPPLFHFFNYVSLLELGNIPNETPLTPPTSPSALPFLFPSTLLLGTKWIKDVCLGSYPSVWVPRKCKKEIRNFGALPYIEMTLEWVFLGTHP